MTWLISISIWELIDFLSHALFQVHLRGVLGMRWGVLLGKNRSRRGLEVGHQNWSVVQISHWKISFSTVLNPDFNSIEDIKSINIE